MNTAADPYTDNALACYRLGSEACLLAMEKPHDWQRKLRANIRKARRLGVTIHPEAILDVIKPNQNERPPVRTTERRTKDR